MWGRNIRVIIIPSILAFTFLGLSICLDSLADFDLFPLVMWIASTGAAFSAHGGINIIFWGNTLVLTSITASMTVNALVTGLMVFKIFRVFREGKSNTTSDGKHLAPTGGTNLRSIIFVMIESGMALFAIQLGRLVVTATQRSTAAEVDISDIIVGIHEMLNVVISSVILLLDILLITSTCLGYNTYPYPGTGVNGSVLLRRTIFSRSC